MIGKYEKAPSRATFGLILGDDVRKAPRKILKRFPNMIESDFRRTKRLNKSGRGKPPESLAVSYIVV